MFRISAIVVALAGGVIFAPVQTSAVTIDWVPVGNPGNVADINTGLHYGAVAYSYNIGKYDVTVAQYVEFLNTNDPTGANSLGLYNADMSTFSGISNLGAGDGSRYFVTGNLTDPIRGVTWYDTIRFANWLNNGQTPGSTETGAYTLGPLGAGGVPINGNSITRNAGANVFLPSESEWYKAAYYDPRTAAQGGPPGDTHYWLFPTGSDVIPSGAGPTATPNTLNILPVAQAMSLP